MSSIWKARASDPNIRKQLPSLYSELALRQHIHHVAFEMNQSWGTCPLALHSTVPAQTRVKVTSDPVRQVRRAHAYRYLMRIASRPRETEQRSDAL